MAISLLPLPYADSALDPTISAVTLQTHHGKHHKAYVDKTNAAIDGTDLADKSLEDIVAAAQAKGDKGLFNNSAQTWNHGFYWHSLTPETSEPTGDLAAAIEASFGSLDALDVLSTAASVIAEGEVLQLSVAKNMETTEDDYLQVIRAKTAALFAAAAEVGPIVAKTDKSGRNALKSYGMNLGLAFQLVDDVLDYGGKAADLGKNVGDDFREGKITLPVILAYRRGTEEERAFWRDAIEGGNSNDANLETALGLITKYGSLADTIARAKHYGTIARDALAPLPQSPWKSALMDVIDFSIQRVN